LSTSPPLILSSLSACSPLPRFRFRLLFLFPPPPATATYTLSLHDALPIFVCFRNLQKRVDSAIALFGDREAGGIVLLHKFDDYYYGYATQDGKDKPGYVDMINELTEKFPLSEPRIEGEQNQKDFIALFGAILRMRNLLLSFDDFKGREMISERDLQDYLGRYQDLRDEWVNRAKGEKEDIT